MSTYFDLIMIPLQLLIVFFTIYYLRFLSLAFLAADRKKNLRRAKNFCNDRLCTQ